MVGAGVVALWLVQEWLLYGRCRSGWCIDGAGVTGVLLVQEWLVYGRCRSG